MMSSLIWGSILVLFGAQLIIQTLFGISLPLVRVAFGVLIVYWGLTILFGDWYWPFSHKYMYSANYSYTHGKDSYNTIWGKQKLDFSTINPDIPQTLNVNTVFGNTQVKLNPTIPTRINGTTTMGTINFPDNLIIQNGSRVYYTHDMHHEPVLTLNVTTTFGNTIIKNHN